MTNPWLDFSPTNKDYIHPKDKDAVLSFNSWVKDKAAYGIKTHIFPAPFMGNVETAPVLILALNPGYDTKEEQNGYYTRYTSHFLDEAKRKNRFEFPLFSLEPMYAQSSPYWASKLKQLCSEPGLSSQIVAQKIAKVQWFPYHSKKFKVISPRLLAQNETYLYTQLYNFHLVNEAIKRDAIIVITRSVKLWYRGVPALYSYQNKFITKNVRQPYITRNNLEKGYDKIVERLLF